MKDEPHRVCTCEEFREALAEGMVDRLKVARDQARRTLYVLTHPSGDPGEGRLILFCPFCGGTVGDGWRIGAELYN
ncbi:hypothetical protein MF271_23695 (plasmid) [Deinococcus sp. KNUC1210]|uniref:hypothetical protein n=1 Tax=Deinococcus sp. KNUC1210 TaxID=2917691 RepID=UPI001EEFE889|nr:hypothetical protein [Deinococcus sp. KNUC1210]ULH17968.1 hypothetical protein MF271_23695 [Deinococcus sp. KNUC1210]